MRFRENRLSVEDFVMPFFVKEGLRRATPIAAMPGQYRHSVSSLLTEAKKARDLGIGALLLFGIPAGKDTEGSSAYDPGGILQQAVRKLKRSLPEMVLIADVCLCGYTSHGHCGILRGRSVDNDSTLPFLARTALTLAEAGADVVAPSDMMDGRVAEIRSLLDRKDFQDVPILSYAAKYASAFYGPFREAAENKPSFGDRRTYQMDPANRAEAMREIAQDLEEGADFVLIKPALGYLDVVRQAKERFDVPVGAYNVSGEYSMIKAASAKGWIEQRPAALESLLSIKRAGADFMITYWAMEAARWLKP